MGLSDEQIKLLLSKPEPPKGGGRGRKPKDYVDTSVRDYATWFKLHTTSFDGDTNDPAHCDNPNCRDPRNHEHHRQLVAKVSGLNMCRYCFLAGYGMVMAGQGDLLGEE